MPKASFKVLTDINKIMTREAARTQKAAETAVKIEAFRLKKIGATLLRKGQLGLTPLSKLKGKKGKGKAPLKLLSRGFLYIAKPGTLSAEVGFVSKPGTQGLGRIAKKAIPGYFWLYTPEEIKAKHKAGIHLQKGTKGGLVPGRDILKAVTDHEGQDKIAANIKRNFDSKMRGEKT